MEGFSEILPNEVVILAETVEWPDEIDANRAKEAQIRAERRLQSQDGDMNRAELAIKVGITTANKDQDRKAFVKTILRNVSVLTVDTIRYTTNEKLDQLLSEPEGIIADEKMTVVLKTVSDMKSQISALQSIME